MSLLIMKEILSISPETGFTSKSTMLRSFFMVTYVHQCVIHFCTTWFCVIVFKQISCLLCFSCFADVYNSSCWFHRWCLPKYLEPSAAWAIYNLNSELIDHQGIYLGRTTNNIVEYSVVIKLLSEGIALGIRELVVNLDSELVVLQLNG